MLSVIVPFRNRHENLNNLQAALTSYLGAMQWELLVIEQTAKRGFNRGALMNIGFSKCRYTQICFHDADMLPIDADYSPVPTPTCLMERCNLYNNSIPYPTYFGGVTQFSAEHFRLVNGFSNQYFNWGKEDDDMWIRCHRSGLKCERRHGTFFHQDHPRDHCNTNGTDSESLLEHFIQSPERQWADGLNSLKYTEVSKRIEGNVACYVVDFD